MMKAYIVIISYLVPVERILETAPAHRAYLEGYYAKEQILFSGMQATQKGGVIVMRASDETEVQALINQDPFYTQGLATYEIITLNVRRYLPFVTNWLQGISPEN